MKSNSPATGDVLVRPDLVTGRGFTLAVAPDGFSQLWYPSYELALQKALAWASASGVSVWRGTTTAQFERVSTQES